LEIVIHDHEKTSIEIGFDGRSRGDYIGRSSGETPTVIYLGMGNPGQKAHEKKTDFLGKS